MILSVNGSVNPTMLVDMSRPHRTAFLLSQLGVLAATHFAELTRDAGLSPSDAGVLRLLARNPGMSQRALADRLGAVPSRVVALVDSLEQRALVRRTRSASDRRNYELTLTDAGTEAMSRLREVAQQQERNVLSPLTALERERLHELLSKLAQGHGLDPDVHPGYAVRSV